MKGVICGIKRMEIHDGDGIRTTVFFKGCPLKCVWCHNPESISFEPQTAFFENKCIHCGLCKNVKSKESALVCPSDALVFYGDEYDTDTLIDIIMQDELFFKNSGGGVTLSGGECLMQSDFASELIQKLNKRNISVYIDTCGFVKREAFEKIMPFADKFLYDIKAIDSDVHKACTGKDNTLILENLKFLCQNNCRVEIRYPLVKGLNDGECNKIGMFLRDLKGISKVKVLQYHSFAKSRYKALDMENTLPDTKTTYQDVEEAVNALKKYGLNAVNGIEG